MNNKVIFIGITNNLVRRVFEHKNGIIEGFTKRYNCKKLIWYKDTNDVKSAIQLEKQMKKWKRIFKINLINDKNPNWNDLYSDFV